MPALPLALGLLIYYGGIQSSSFLLINQITQYVPDRIWAGLTFLGNGWGTFALAFPLLLLAPRLLSAGILAGLLGGLAIAILKPLVNLPRPASVLASGDFHQIGEALLYHSMPSGHTLTAFAVASGLYFASAIEKRKALLCLFVLASLVGLSRSAVGAHWLSDEFVAVAIGLWCGILGSFFGELDSPWSVELESLVASLYCTVRAVDHLPITHPKHGFGVQSSFAICLCPTDCSDLSALCTGSAHSIQPLTHV